MTQTDLFIAFGNVNEDYRSAAIKSIQYTPSGRRTLRFTLIAATLLVLVTIPIAVIIANHYGITPPPPIPTITTDTTAAPTTTEKVYQSLYDIPGATELDEETKEQLKNASNSFSLSYHDIPSSRFFKIIEETKYPVVIGTIENVDSILLEKESYDIENTDLMYTPLSVLVSVITVRVSERLVYASDVPETIKVFVYFRFQKGSEYWGVEHAKNIVSKISEDNQSFLFLLNPNDSSSYRYDEKIFIRSDYADYELALYGKLITYEDDHTNSELAGKLCAYSDYALRATPIDDIRALGKKRNE